MFGSFTQRLSSNPYLGFERVGLGIPDFLWVAEDQSPSDLSVLKMRVGEPWTTVALDGSSIVLEPTGWGGTRPTLSLTNAGQNVRCGIRGDSFAPGLCPNPGTLTPDAWCRTLSYIFVAPPQREFGPYMQEQAIGNGTNSLLTGPMFRAGQPNYWWLFNVGSQNVIGNVGYTDFDYWPQKRIIRTINYYRSPGDVAGTTKLASLATYSIEGAPAPFTRYNGGYIPTQGNVGTFNFSRISLGYRGFDDPTNACSDNFKFVGCVGWTNTQQGAQNGNLPNEIFYAIHNTWNAYYPVN
jgi:hypothetical protein